MGVAVATGATIARLEALYPEPGRPIGRHAQRWELQQHNEALYLVASADDRPVGWVLLKWIASRDPGLAELADLQVVETERGKGHGSALLDAAIAAAREEGRPGIGLSVTVANPYNEVARQLYASRGFVDGGRGDYEEGYSHWTPDGEQHWDGELHRYLVLRF